MTASRRAGSLGLWRRVLACTGLALACACASDAEVGCGDGQQRASVEAVSTAGGAGSFAFTIEVRADDRDCGCQADYWEIVGIDGVLLQRHPLPARSAPGTISTTTGAALTLSEDLYVVVRAHMRGGAGDGVAAMRGSVRDGFVAYDATGFGLGLSGQGPQPPACP